MNEYHSEELVNIQRRTALALDRIAESLELLIDLYQEKSEPQSYSNKEES